MQVFDFIKSALKRKQRKPCENGKISLSQERIMEDLFYLTLLELSEEDYKIGQKYRINIMEPDKNKTYLEINKRYHLGYGVTPNKKIAFGLPGAPQAWDAWNAGENCEPKCISNHYDDLIPNFDPSLRHLWSVAIVATNPKRSVAVLNIDRVDKALPKNDFASDYTIKHMCKISEKLSKLIGYYYQKIPT